MRPFLQPKPRPSLRLAVQLGAGLLVPMWIAPALAQGVAVITPSPAMAPREEREKLAPAVMAPAVNEAEQTANQLAWSESLKRMSAAEADDPSRALTAYKRFFSERTMSPVLGVEVGVKIAQLRLKLGDNQGALQTCEVLAAKYADEPTSVLFSLEKARVLMEGKHLAEASQCVNEAMPELVALGPSRYREISDLLLQLVQANLDDGDVEGKKRAQTLCVGIEEIYLQWMKKDAIDRLWQRFEALQVNYQHTGNQKRAKELLSKVSDMVLKTQVKKGYIEGVDVFLEAARWLEQQGNSEEANILYKKISDYGDTWQIELALRHQAKMLISKGNHHEARQILKMGISGKDSDQFTIVLLSLLARSYYETGEFDLAKQYSQRAIEADSNVDKSAESRTSIPQAILDYSEKWANQSIIVDSTPINISITNQDTRRVLVRTHHDVPIEVQISNPQISGHVSHGSIDSGYFVQKEVILRIAPGLLGKKVDAILAVSSPNFPNYHMRIPIHIEVPSPIKSSSSTVFFGSVEAGTTATQKFTFSSSTPFQILSAQSDSPSLQVKISKEESSLQQYVELKFSPQHAQRFYSGNFQIQTDMATQPKIEVLYAAHAK